MIKSRISEKELDNLLRQSFLSMEVNENNTGMLDAVAKHIFSPDTAGIHSSGNLSRKIWLIVSSAGFVMFMGLLLVHSTGNKEKNKGVSQSPVKNLIPASGRNEREEKKVVAVMPEIKAVNKQIGEKHQVVPLRDDDQFWLQSLLPEKNEVAVNTDSVPLGLSKKQDDDEAYIFPILTEKEKKSNEKEKRRLIRIMSRLTREKRGEMVRVPASADASIGSFYMGGSEVTNDDYRTFLFDLLIQGRKEEFMKAKPNQALWRNAEGLTVFNPLEKVYFSDKKYNDFPVVNISVEGAEMYCKWLEEGVEGARMKDSKIPKTEVRLPYENEWYYAAASGRKNAMYTWPHDSIQNLKNCFMANCCIQKLKEKIARPICDGHMKVNEDCYTSAGMMLRDPGAAAVYVWCYNPNAFGFFAMCGNVSEMVYINGTRNIKTKGGNWASDFEHLKLNSEDEFEGNVRPSPRLGFRISAFVRP